MLGRLAHRSRHSSLNIEGGGTGGFIFALTGRKVGWFVTWAFSPFASRGVLELFRTAILSQTSVSHLNNDDLDHIAEQAALRKTAGEILEKLARRRRKTKTEPPKVWAVRRAMRGATHKRERVETRGRHSKLTPL